MLKLHSFRVFEGRSTHKTIGWDEPKTVQKTTFVFLLDVPRSVGRLADVSCAHLSGQKVILNER